VRKLCYLVVAMIGFAMPGLCPAADRTATISGYVRNANGVPQMGAAVDVLSSALQRLRVFTDENGFFSASGLVPGYYTLKVSAPAFLPTLRDKINLRLQSILDQHTDPWGVKVSNVEVKQVDLPETMTRRGVFGLSPARRRADSEVGPLGVIVAKGTGLTVTSVAALVALQPLAPVTVTV